jgi:adenylylsulfate kinase
VSSISDTSGTFPVLWITGLAGAGKTTLAERVSAKLKAELKNTILIDGDAIREVCGHDLGYTEPERIKNAYRLSRLAKFLSEQGQLVICSTMSLYPEIWAWNRSNIANYIEVFIEVPFEVLRQRDKKGLYSSEAAAVVGRDLQFNRPEKADIVLMNDTPDSLDRNVELLLRSVQEHIRG